MADRPALNLASRQPDAVSTIVDAFETACRAGGRPRIDDFRGRLRDDGGTYGLAELVKADLENRFRRGERPSAREYLDRYPELAGPDGHALSLIYEEYCLRVENDEPVEISEFCDDYASWRESLRSQLLYHQQLSRAVDPSTSGPIFPEAGDRFADFELVKVLGRGAAAVVFLARSQSLGGKEFVLKVTLDRGVEPSILGRLDDHPNIVSVVSIVVDPATGLRGMCMPYRPGRPLDAILRALRRRGATPPRSASALRELIVAGSEEKAADVDWPDFPKSDRYVDGVAWIGLKIAGALAHAHSKGFIHRDVKPDNILLSGREGPQLFDFNLAHSPDLVGQARAAHRGGTLPYMAREHLLAFLDASRWDGVGEAADVFSLGLILRELLTLEAPFRPGEGLPLDRALNAMLLHRSSPPASVRDSNAAAPHALAAIVAKCLADRPEDRYSSAAALADDLGRYLGRRPLRHVANPSISETAGNFVRRRRGLFAVAGLVVALAALAWRAPEAARTWAFNARQSDLLTQLDAAVDGERSGDHDRADRLISGVIERPGARAALETAIPTHPKSLALRMGRAKAALAEKDYPAAEAAFGSVLAASPGHLPAYAGLAQLEKTRGRPLVSIEWMERGIARAETASSLRLVATLRATRSAARLESTFLGGASLGAATWSLRSVERARSAELAAWRGPSLADMRLFAGRTAFTVASDLVNRRQLDASIAEFDRAFGHFQALRTRNADGGTDERAWFAREFFSAAAKYGLGDAQLAAGRTTEAGAALEAAAEHLGRIHLRRELSESDPAVFSAIQADEARRTQLENDLKHVEQLEADVRHDLLHLDDARAAAGLARRE